MDRAEAIKKKLAAQAGKLAKLRDLKVQAKERSARSEKARSLHLVEALTGNREAEKELEHATVEFDAACLAESDVADAIAQVEQETARLNAALDASEQDARREHARGLIEKAIADKHEQRVFELAGELEKEMAGTRTSNAEIVAALGAVDDDLANRAREILLRRNDLVRVDYGFGGRRSLGVLCDGAAGFLAILLKLTSSRISPDEAPSSDEVAVPETAGR